MEFHDPTLGILNSIEIIEGLENPYVQKVFSAVPYLLHQKSSSEVVSGLVYQNVKKWKRRRKIKVIHPKYYKELKETAQHSHLGR